MCMIYAVKQYNWSIPKSASSNGAFMGIDHRKDPARKKVGIFA